MYDKRVYKKWGNLLLVLKAKHPSVGLTINAKHGPTKRDRDNRNKQS